MNDNKDTIEDLFNRLGEQEKQNVINYAYLYDDIRGLIRKIRHLQSNWNSLREWLKENEDKISYMEDVLDKMNELEGKK